MRHLPTLTLLVGAWLVGCAADASDPADDADRTSGRATAEPGDQDDDAEGAPAFDAQFSPDGGASGNTPPTTTATCEDKEDPGTTEPLAKVLPETSNCNEKLIPQEGILKTASDVDMYKLAGKDSFWCKLDSKFETASRGIELCVFARCQNSTANPVTGCKGGTEATSDLGWKGCCTDGPGDATPKVSCDGLGLSSSSMDFFIRVKPKTANVCVDYAFSYVF